MKNTIKKAALMIVAGATVVSVVRAELGDETPADWTTFDGWFNGDGVKTPESPSESDGKLSAESGAWNPTNGVWHTDDYNDSPRFSMEKFRLEFAEDFSFNSSDSLNLTYGGFKYRTGVVFRYSCSELPDIDDDAKAGAIVYRGNYWVVGKGDGDANEWKDTAISAANLDRFVEVALSIDATNGVTYATYSFDNVPYTTAIVSSGRYAGVSYSGCGEITTLDGQVGDYYPLYEVARGVSKKVARDWAGKFHYANNPEVKDVKDDKELHDLLNSKTVLANGLTPGECCLMGVGTGDVVTAKIDDIRVDAERLSFDIPAEVISNRAELVLEKMTSRVGDVETYAGYATNRLHTGKFGIDFTTGVYKVAARIDGGRLDEINPHFGRRMGVKYTEKPMNEKATAGYCEVPYEDYAEGVPISISNIFKKAFLVDGDQLGVFDSSDSSWKTFRFNGESMIWEGVESNGVKPNPSETTIKRGLAFKFSRPNSDSVKMKPAFIGYVTDDEAKINIPAKTYELVAMVDRSTFDFTKLQNDDRLYKVAITNGALKATPTVEYYQKKGEWYKFDYVGGRQVSEKASSIQGPFFLGSRQASNISFGGNPGE